MGRLGQTVIIAITLLTTGSAAAGGLMRGSEALVVRVYRPAAAVLASGARGEGEPVRLAHAIEEARDILQRAGLGARWVVCGTSAADSDVACKAPLTPAHIGIRLVRSVTTPDAGTEMASMGYALIGRHGPPSSLATIFLDRVQWLAGRAGADVSRLAGRAMAHEVGHLLLSTHDHAPSGLMRARWSIAELQAPGRTPWDFTTRDMRRLRAGLAARLRDRRS